MSQYQSLSKVILPPPGPRRWIAIVLFVVLVVPVLWFFARLVLPRAPGARYGNAAAALDGRIYAIGGAGRDGPESRVESLDPETGEWRGEADLLVARVFHGAAVLDGRIFVMGGLAGSGELEIASVEIFDPARSVWEEGPPLPRPLSRLAAAQSDDAVFVVGGMSIEDGDLSSVYVLRSGATSWDTLPSMPTRRHGASAAVWNGALYVVGGYRSGEILDRLEVYESEWDTWSDRAAIAVPRGFAGLQAVSGRLYLFGGRVRQRRVITETYSVESGEWNSGASIPEWRDRFASVALDDRIYLIGGEASFGVCCGGRVLVYDPRTNEWSKM